MIDFIDIRGWSHKQWLDFRENGIGGSEQGGVFNESKWDDSLKIYLNKIGEPVTTFTGNRFTRFGQRDEPEIANLFQYWDGTGKDPVMSMFDNIDNKKKISTVRSVFSYVVNDKYPWLFASMDRRILRSKRNGYRRGILECKNSTSMEKNTYPLGINPGFVLQVYQYLMITEWEYAEVAIKFDGNNFEVVEFEPNKVIFEDIAETSRLFWIDVLKGRKIKIEHDIPTYYGMPDYYWTTQKQLDGIAKLQALEPEITSRTYNWIKDIIAPTTDYTEMQGTQDIFELALLYHKTQSKGKVHKEELDRIKASLIIKLNGCHVAKFDDGVVSYKPTSKGSNRLHISQKLIT